MSVRTRKAYRADEAAGYELLTDADRRRAVKASLPSLNDAQAAAAASNASKTKRSSRFGVRQFIKTQIHVLVFAIMHGIFSLYIRTRQMWNIVGYQIASVLYYHHGTPQYIQKDVTGLARIPTHLSAILRTEGRRHSTDLERLIDETAELATWCACAEIPMLSIYEKSGILKKHIHRVYEAVEHKLAFYYGGQHPALSVTSPHKESCTSPNWDLKKPHLKLHLISYQDGRDSMVDLTRTLTEMSQNGKLSPQDISMELIDAELTEGIMPEPDLLILFTPNVELNGYPPWQIRLTEIFCLQDNEGFGYQVFLRALKNYASAQMRKGR